MKLWRLRKLFNKVLVVLLCISFLAQSSPLLAMSYESVERASRERRKTVQEVDKPDQAAKPSADIVRIKSPAGINRPENRPETAAPWPEQRPNNTLKGAPVLSNVAQTPSWSVDEAPLLSGWNLVSLPKIPPNTDPSAVLSGIIGQTEVVFAYDGCQPDNPWQVYDPAAPPATNDLTAIDQTIGFWLEANTAATLPFAGTLPPTTTIEICTGWNLISMPTGQARPVRNALFSIDGKYTRVFGYEPEDAEVPWTIYDVSAPDWANDLQMMEPGRGYWVLATENATMTLANQGAPPIARLLSPDDQATEITSITFITDVIGTAYSGLMESWTLSYRPESGAEWQEFATGTTPVITDTLDEFDPTLLLNGLYEMELAVTDYEGVTALSYADLLVDGTKLGNFRLTYQDLKVPVAGFPLQVVRTYDSRNKEVGDFGVGWSLDMNDVRLEESTPPGDGWESALGNVSENPVLPFFDYCLPPTLPHIVSITFSGGTVYRFRPTVSPECQLLIPHTIVDITYEPMPGTAGTLVSVDQSSQNLLVVGGNPAPPLDFGDGPLGSFEPVPNQFWNQDIVALHDPNVYELTLSDGRSLIISQDNGLQSITDQFGNVLTVNDNGISHSSGIGLVFTRDEQGRIVRITDPADNFLDYSYDDDGNLFQVSKEGTLTTTYTYDTNHYLIDIQDPSGNQPIRSEYDEDGRLVRQIDAQGNVISYTHNLVDGQEIITDLTGEVTLKEYDESGNLIRETDALGNVELFTYDSLGNLTSQADPLGNTTSFVFEDDSVPTLPTLITDPIGNIHAYTYNSRGQVTTAVDRVGNVITNTYDSNGNLTGRVYETGSTDSFTYNARGELLSEGDISGCLNEYEYDDMSNVIKTIDGENNTKQFSYDVYGNLLSETITRTLPSGEVTQLTTTYEYDINNRLTKTNYPDGTFIRTDYDVLGRRTAEYDELGRVTTYEYDLLGNLVLITYPDNSTETFTYDEMGRLLSVTDRDGLTKYYTYDAAHQLTRITLEDGPYVITTYDAAGRVVAQTNANGNTIYRGYNDAGYLTVVTNTLGLTTTYTYDGVGNRLSETDANGNTIYFEYDDENRRIRTLYPDGTEERTVYDIRGLVAARIDQEGIGTQFAYDCNGQLIQVTDALSQTTIFEYDESGNLISETDSNNNTTSFVYDERSRLISQTLPLGQVAAMVYDDAGNLVSKTDYNNNTISYTYDVNNQLIQKTYPDGSVISYTYSANGQRTSVTDNRGTITYDYDDLNRLVRIDHPDGRFIQYTYDNAGNRTSVTTPGGTTTYSYTELNQLYTVIEPSGRVMTYTYDAVGNISSIAYANNTFTQYNVDELNRLISLNNVHTNTGLFSGFTYNTDLVGNRTWVTENSGRTVNYTYDDLYRLVEEEIVDPINGSTIISYTYDAVGNRLSRTENGLTTFYTYDANNRIISESGATVVNYAFDNNGNLLSRDVVGGEAVVYSYNYENQLIEAQVFDSSGTTTLNFAYDADGNRVQTVVDGVDVTNYLVDINSPLSQVLMETDSSGTILANYIYGSDLLSVQQAGNSSYYHYDGQLSVRQLTDSTGTITDQYTYDTFGNMLAQSGSSNNNYRYSGEQFTPFIDAYYLRARYYQPEVGRFLTRDPFAGLQNNPATLHKYTYVSNNPANNVDPSGLFALATTLQGLRIRGEQETKTTPAYMAILGRVALTIAKVAVIECAEKFAISFFGPYQQVFAGASPCRSALPTVYWDITLPEIAGHTALAQIFGHPAVLHYRVKPEQPFTPAAQCRKIYGEPWELNNVTNPPRAMQCDEFPYWSTIEGGEAWASKTTSFLWVGAAQNIAQGVKLRIFYPTCGVRPLTRRGKYNVFGAVPIPVALTIPFDCGSRR